MLASSEGEPVPSCASRLAGASGVDRLATKTRQREHCPPEHYRALTQRGEIETETRPMPAPRFKRRVHRDGPQAEPAIDRQCPIEQDQADTASTVCVLQLEELVSRDSAVEDQSRARSRKRLGPAYRQR
jgi:hypothetical protein